MSTINRRDALRSGMLAAAAGCVFGADANANERTSVGFAQGDISACIRTKAVFRRPLEVICVAFSSGGVTVILAALDLCEMPAEDCRRLQEEVSVATRVRATQVLIHTTHTHSAPMDVTKPGLAWADGLGEVIGQCAQRAIRAMRPARVRWGASNVGQRLSVNRRGDCGPDLGIQTFWFGYRYHPGDDRPDASPLAHEMLCRWRRQPPVYQPGLQPIWFDGPVDPWVVSAAFEDDDGRPLGSIVRFSAHPHLACLCRDGKFDPDFPRVTRAVVAAKLGGACMFLQGTSGDVVPKDKVPYVLDPRRTPPFPYLGPTSSLVPENAEAMLTELERIGGEVATAAVTGLANQPVEKLPGLRFLFRPHAVPLDPALPRSAQEVGRRRAGLAGEYLGALNQNAPVRELRRLANRLNWLSWMPAQAFHVCTPEEFEAGSKELPMAALWLGAHCLLFLHSEITAETNRLLCEAHPGLNLITVSLTGGTIGYVPTAEMVDQGGYEGRQTMISRDAERLLREHASAMLRDRNR